MATINELIATLQDMAEAMGGDTEVKMAHQPGYELEVEITGVAIDIDEEENLNQVTIQAFGREDYYRGGNGRVDEI